VLDQIVFYLSPMGDTKVPFVTKPCRSLPVRRRRVGNRGARRPRADEGTPLLFPFVASPPDIRCVFWTRPLPCPGIDTTDRAPFAVGGC
jgi:hypothetical protein